MTREKHLKNNWENDMVISYGYRYNDIVSQLFCILVLKKVLYWCIFNNINANYDISVINQADNISQHDCLLIQLSLTWPFP